MTILTHRGNTTNRFGNPVNYSSSGFVGGAGRRPSFFSRAKSFLKRNAPSVIRRFAPYIPKLVDKILDYNLTGRPIPQSTKDMLRRVTKHAPAVTREVINQIDPEVTKADPFIEDIAEQAETIIKGRGYNGGRIRSNEADQVERDIIGILNDTSEENEGGNVVLLGDTSGGCNGCKGGKARSQEKKVDEALETKRMLVQGSGVLKF